MRRYSARSTLSNGWLDCKESEGIAMRMVIRSSGGMHEVDVEGLLSQKRILFLEEAITMEKASAFAKQMMYLTWTATRPSCSASIRPAEISKLA